VCAFKSPVTGQKRTIMPTKKQSQKIAPVVTAPKKHHAGSQYRRVTLELKVTARQRKEFFARAAYYEYPSELLLQIFFDSFMEMTEGNPTLTLPLRLQERLK
jgi:hypothetical protein